MATSGSINLTATGQDIIKEALELVGGLNENGTPTANQIASSQRSLNYMVKAWQADEPNLFALQSLTLFLVPNQNKYSLSASTTDHFTTTAEVVHTELAVAGAASDGTITVDSDTGISDGDYIGIELDDGTVQWTTVNGAPAANVITLTASLTGAAAIDNTVYAYTNKANRPMKIVHAVRSNEDYQDIEIDIIPFDQYGNQTEKTEDGRVLEIYYDPQVTTGYLYVWPETDVSTDFLTIQVQRTLEDIDTASTDDMDYPQEWFMALSYGLAVILANKYGLTATEKQELKDERDMYRDMASGFDRDPYTEILPEPNWD